MEEKICKDVRYVGIEIPKALYAEAIETMRIRHFPSMSEYIRHLIRSANVDQPESKGGDHAGE